MNILQKYFEDTIGLTVQPTPLGKQQIGGLPSYLCEMYKLFTMTLLDKHVVLAEPKHPAGFSIHQTTKHFDFLGKALGQNVVLLMPSMTPLTRKRLIENGVNFIVPGKQLYLPDLLIDLREQFVNPRAKKKNEALLPFAQFLLLYHILHKHDAWGIEDHSFKEIAKKTGYTQMSVTKAVDSLRYHELIDVKGDKEKFILFRFDRAGLWHECEKRKLLIDPVIKKVFVDEKPKVDLLYCNISALTEYSDINPSNQISFALDKRIFYDLVNKNLLTNLNDHEGRYCIEVWKYNPNKLTKGTGNALPVVDPLSLYLSLQDSKDERIEMALNKIIQDNIYG